MIIARATGLVRCAPQVAPTLAAKRGESWGYCVFDGKAYVGPAKELDKVGVIVEGE